MHADSPHGAGIQADTVPNEVIYKLLQAGRFGAALKQHSDLPFCGCDKSQDYCCYRSDRYSRDVRRTTAACDCNGQCSTPSNGCRPSLATNGAYGLVGRIGCRSRWYQRKRTARCHQDAIKNTGQAYIALCCRLGTGSLITEPVALPEDQ